MQQQNIMLAKADSHLFLSGDTPKLIDEQQMIPFNGKYTVVEIRLFDDDLIEQGTKNLLRLRDEIDTSKMKEPSFFVVITGTSYAYQREDGVYVVQLTCLKY